MVIYKIKEKAYESLKFLHQSLRQFQGLIVQGPFHQYLDK